MHKVLVAGGAGFIGSVLVAHLRDAGHAVTVMSRSAVPESEHVRSIRLPDWRGATVDGIEERPEYDWVFNLTAYGVDPRKVDETAARQANVELPMVLARVAKRAGAIAYIHAGSMFEYVQLPTNRRLVESDPLEEEDLYGRTKAAGSLGVIDLARTIGLGAVVARVFGVYGEGERPWRLLPTIHATISGGGTVPLTEGGQVRDLMYVADVADGLVALAHMVSARSGSPDVVNLCTGVGISVRRFAEAIVDALGASRKRLLFGALHMRPHEKMHLVGSTSLLHCVTDWRPAYSLEAGVASACVKLTNRGSSA